jgi:topoisomerase-4 subunit A
MCGEPDDLYVLATDVGYGFVVALGDLYTRQRAGKVVLTLPRGGNYKLMGFSSNGSAERRQVIVALACFQADQPLTLYCRQRHLTLKPADAEYYTGTRGRRGASLSRGFQRVDRLCAHGNHHLG